MSRFAFSRAYPAPGKSSGRVKKPSMFNARWRTGSHPSQDRPRQYRGAGNQLSEPTKLRQKRKTSLFCDSEIVRVAKLVNLSEIHSISGFPVGDDPHLPD